MDYRLSRKAADDIFNLYIEGVEQFGSTQADKYHSALEETFRLLAHSPKIAREREELSPPVRIHRFQSHVIVYREEDHGILIIRVRHGREDWLSAPE